MNKPFSPHVPEEKINCSITKKEAVLIEKLRTYNFGRFTVHKANNMIVRLEVNESLLINEKDATIGIEE